MTTPPPDEPTPDPTRWRSLAICLVAAAMTLLDLSIVNVALPSLRQSLGADESDLQWIVAGYALAFGVVLVPAGRLGDARSRRTIFIIGIALFTLSSAVAGAAPNPTVLAVARVAQGLAGGLISPQTSGFIQNLFRGRERARAFGLLGAAIGVSTAIGPLHHTSWWTNCDGSDCGGLQGIPDPCGPFGYMDPPGGRAAGPVPVASHAVQHPKLGATCEAAQDRRSAQPTRR